MDVYCIFYFKLLIFIFSHKAWFIYCVLIQFSNLVLQHKKKLTIDTKIACTYRPDKIKETEKCINCYSILVKLSKSHC